MTTLKPLYFDCETIPNYELTDVFLERRSRPDFEKDPSPTAAQDWLDMQAKAMALQPEACKLVGLNVAIGEGDCKSGWVGEPSPTGELYDEAALLRMWWSWAATAPRLIGFNCINFDLNVIRVRSAMLGVAPTRNLFDLKPWQDDVIDLLQRRFKGTPREQYLSLKALRRLLGFQVPGKYAEVLDNTGGDVEQLYLQFVASDDAEALRLLKMYGELDIWTTRALAQHWSGYFYQRIE